MFFFVLAVVGGGKIVGSFLSARQSYSSSPFKYWCKRRIIYFSSAILSVIAFTAGEISLWWTQEITGFMFGTGFIAVIARPCSFEVFNTSKVLKLARNLFWLGLAIVSVIYIK